MAHSVSLGFSESIVPITFIVIISGCYTKAEQTSRQCAWYSSTSGWTVLGAVINFGFSHIYGGGLHNWQYLYLLAGAITVRYGILCFFIPNSPITAWWFSSEGKVAAVERLHMGQVGVHCQKVKWRYIRE
jgi:MFS family permease